MYYLTHFFLNQVTGKKAYTTSQEIYEAVKSLWTNNSKKESLPEPKEKTKVEFKWFKRQTLSFVWVAVSL